MLIFNKLLTISLTKAPIKSALPKTYKMRLKAKDNKTGEIFLYGDIGQSFWSEGISANQFRQDLRALGDITALDIRIESEGGDVFDGRAIYSLIAEHKAKKTVYVDGIAGSIASVIAMAGDEIVMGDGTWMMIHNAWGVAVGNAAKMRDTANLLESVSGSIADTYAARTGQDRKQVVKWMDDETWMDAKTCMDRGFCTKVSEPIRAAAKVMDADRYRNLPAALRPRRAALLSMISKMRKNAAQ